MKSSSTNGKGKISRLTFLANSTALATAVGALSGVTVAQDGVQNAGRITDKSKSDPGPTNAALDAQNRVQSRRPTRTSRSSLRSARTGSAPSSPSRSPPACDVANCRRCTGRIWIWRTAACTCARNRSTRSCRRTGRSAPCRSRRRSRTSFAGIPRCRNALSSSRRRKATSTSASCTSAARRSPKELGLSKAEWHLHRFRDTAATRWLRAGIDVRTVQECLGHESLATTQNYLEPSKETERQLEAMKLPF